MLGRSSGWRLEHDTYKVHSRRAIDKGSLSHHPWIWLRSRGSRQTSNSIPTARPAGDEDELSQVVEVNPVPGNLGGKIGKLVLELDDDTSLAASDGLKKEGKLVHVDDVLILARSDDNTDDSLLDIWL